MPLVRDDLGCLDELTLLDGTTAREAASARVVELRGKGLTSVDPLADCARALQVALLSGNLLSALEEPIMQCSRLLKLDLSNNGISTLPKREEWARLPELQCLYLHGNQLGSLKMAGRLAALPKLVRATFFDNPLATHQNYRHFLVNSIFSLRALDMHVISDEELIEGAKFPAAFATLSEAALLPLYGADEIDEAAAAGVPATLKSEAVQLRDRAAEIMALNRVHHKLSPVLTMESAVRGMQARRRVLRLREERKSAGVVQPPGAAQDGLKTGDAPDEATGDAPSDAPGDAPGDAPRRPAPRRPAPGGAPGGASGGAPGGMPVLQPGREGVSEGVSEEVSKGVGEGVGEGVSEGVSDVGEKRGEVQAAATNSFEVEAAATNSLLASSEDLGDGIGLDSPQLPRSKGKQAADSSPKSTEKEREREAQRAAAKFTRENLGGANLGGANLGGDGLGDDGLGGDGLGGEGRDGENLGDAGLGDAGLGDGGLGDGGLGDGGAGEATEPAQGRRTSVKLNNRAYGEAEVEAVPPHLYVQARHLAELQGLALAAIFEPDAPEREAPLPTETTTLYTVRRAT